MTDDLVQFLRDRLDEDETVARTAGDSWYGYEPEQQIAFVSAADSRHIARHSPARVLAEIEAHRQIVDDMADVVGGEYIDDGEPILAEWVLQRLSLLYADHPGYSEEWRPVTG